MGKRIPGRNKGTCKRQGQERPGHECSGSHWPMYVCVLYDSWEGGKRRKKDFEVCLLRNDRPGRSIYSV